MPACLPNSSSAPKPACQPNLRVDTVSASSSLQRVDLGGVPTWTAEHVGRERPAHGKEQQRRLKRILADALIEQLEFLAVAIERHLETGPRRQAQCESGRR